MKSPRADPNKRRAFHAKGEHGTGSKIEERPVHAHNLEE
jgi:hypothetical protein